MNAVVDPTPLVRAELDAARERFQPLLDDMDRQLSAASSRGERRDIRHRRRDIKRQYDNAQRQATWLLRGGVVWYLGDG